MEPRPKKSVHAENYKENVWGNGNNVCRRLAKGKNEQK